MPFLTQGKTDWKFLLIVIVLAVIAGGGILLWQYFEPYSDFYLIIIGVGFLIGFLIWWYLVLSPEERERKRAAQKESIERRAFYRVNIWILALIVFFAVGLLTWIVINSYLSAKERMQTTQQTSIKEEAVLKEVIEDEVADWQTYRNEEYGFEMKYPLNWDYYVFKNGDIMIFPEELMNKVREVSETNGPDKYLTFTIGYYEKQEYDVYLHPFIDRGVFRLEASTTDIVVGNIHGKAYMTKARFDVPPNFSRGDIFIDHVIPYRGGYLIFSLLDYQYISIFKEVIDSIVLYHLPSSSFEICLAKGYPTPELPPGFVSYPRQCKDPEGNIFIEELERDVEAEKANWSSCDVFDDISKAIKSFNCPNWMQDMSLFSKEPVEFWDESYQDDNTLKFYFYNALDKKNQKAYLSKKTGGIALLIENIIEEEWDKYRGFTSIKFIYPNRKIVTLYIRHINTGGYQQGIYDIKFSPDGQYIILNLSGWECFRTSIIDINSGRDILADSEINISAFACDLEKMIWSSDGKYIAVSGEWVAAEDQCPVRIFIGNMAKGGRLTKIFEMGEEEKWREDKRITKLIFDEDNTNIYFSVETPSKEIKYKYNIPDEKLIMTGEFPLH